MRTLRSLLFASALLLASGPAYGQDVAQHEEAAKAAAASWVALVDSARYAESWEQAAPLFRQSVTPEQWAEAVRQARGPLGRLTLRMVQEVRYTTSLPNAPEGEYVVLQYASRFATLPEAAETVVMTKTGEGTWKAAGYFVRPAE